MFVKDPKQGSYIAFFKDFPKYAAYGLLRGKKLSQVEQNYSEEDPTKIEKTLEGMKQMSQIKEENK